MKALRVLVPVLLVLTACTPRSTEETGTQAAGATAAVGEAEKLKTPVPDKAMPDLVGRRLTEARASLTEAGFTNVLTVDGTDRNRPVLEPDNWIVREQSPRPGLTVPVSNQVTLRVTKPTDGQGSDTTTGGVIPDVVCKDLQAAQDALQKAGFFNLRSADGTGKGREQLVDRNWVVTAQSAAPGTKPDALTKITLTAVKFGEPTGASNCPS